MATTYLAPDPIQSMQFIPGGIVPANGGQLFFYAAGTSTKTTVYKDNAAAVAWSNPIVLDSGGNLPSGGEVWFQSGISYKVIFAPSNDTDPPTSPYWTKDNLQGMNDVSSQISVLEWVAGPTPTFVSTTSLTVIGDYTATLTVGRRIKTTNTGGTIYSTITASSFGAGITTITVVNDSGVLDSGLSAMSYGFLASVNQSVPPGIADRGTADKASATTTNIWTNGGTYMHITGTTAIANFGTAQRAGQKVTLVFNSACPINSSASMLLPNRANMTTAAGDIFTVVADSVSVAQVTNYEPINRLMTRQVLTSSSGTYITPNRAIAINVYAVGGGGGGAGNVTTTAGSTGTSTTFGTLTANGGSGGGAAGVFVGGAGGTASGGDLNISGGAGQGPGLSATAGVTSPGGCGGNGFLGGGGAGNGNNNSGGPGGANSGGGGGGGGGVGATNSGAGGGAGGLAIKMFSPPSSSYAYSIGPGGTGSSGVNTSGGAGGSGVVIIDEYYLI